MENHVSDENSLILRKNVGLTKLKSKIDITNKLISNGIEALFNEAFYLILDEIEHWGEAKENYYFYLLYDKDYIKKRKFKFSNPESRLYDSEVPKETVIDLFEQVIKLKPDFKYAYNYLGILRSFKEGSSQNGEATSAIKEFTKAIEIDPKYTDAYLNRAFQRWLLNDKKGALADFDKAVEIAPNWSRTFSSRAKFKQRFGYYEEAIKDLTSAIKIDSKIYDFYILRGRLYLRLKKYQEAIIDFSKAIEIDPADHTAYIDRANIKENLSDYRGAMMDYSSAIEIANNDADQKFSNVYDWYFNRALILELLNDWEAAISDYSKIIEERPNHSKAFKNRGIIKRKLGRIKDAEEDEAKYRELTNAN